jgi:thiamine pyrophosphate-dependent acetolactate synthase large subunit-like protein
LLSTSEERPTDLTNIIENNSAYNIVKEEEQLEKSIVMNNEEVIDFVKIAKGTFGIFRVKTEDNRVKGRYLLMYIVF